ncbi:hypothetical protein Pla123a_20910 [Posidoniimonas polymericola]|uniref:Uncharacterized protein n=1 Tax=Posidoniimonas polymericola TaxID=2528002 RepID=A0A5C5YRS3_9BACT|nr:hypothetical protein [Posidoniimonas polymericola]TWT77430.1 hypothetical protein Pla123a_20910 [Posidoniimonas polymericola]
MKSSLLAAALLLPLSFLTPTAFGQTDSVSLADAVDASYDFELYVAEPETATAWFMLWTWEDGYQRVSYRFDTKAAAEREWIRMLQHLTDPRLGSMDADNLISVDFFEGLAEPRWEYIETYATLAEAEEGAQWWEERLGLITDIRMVSTLKKATTLKTVDSLR